MQNIKEEEYRKQQKEIEAQARANSQRIEAKGHADSRRLEGYNWADEQIAEITKLYAANPGNIQNPANMFAQAPVALAFGNMLKGNMEPLMGMQFSNPPINFSNGNSKKDQFDPENLKDDMFQDITVGIYDDVSPLTDVHDEAISEPKEKETMQNDPIEILSKLKKMVEMGLMKQEQYDKKLEEIIAKMG